jgi:lipooligosaccharide transport system permease protein
LIQSLRNIFLLVSWPEFDRESSRLLMRHWQQLTYRPIAETLGLLADPLLMLTALGFGVGYWIPEIEGQSYSQFVLPAVAGLAVTFIPFWQTSQEAFLGMRAPSAYWAILQSPLSAQKIASGEILWAALKGCIAAVFTLAVGYCLGWANSPAIWLGIFMLLPVALFFSALGLWLGARAKRNSSLILAQCLGLGLLAFWSDTIFPISQWNWLSKSMTLLSPVTHLVGSLRTLARGEIHAEFFLDLAILWVLACVSVNIACRVFAARLIPR